VQIADREQHVLVAPRQLWTDLGPLFDPAVEGRAQERERALGHLAVLSGQQLRRDIGTALHPGLECRRGV
jgi:hypothetical protein